MTTRFARWAGRIHTVDYLAGTSRPGTLLDRGWWIRDLPRLIPVCRLLGHRPVVDGTTLPGSPLARWVCCDRCGVRPNPQGALDPAEWEIGQPYTGPYAPTPHLAQAGYHPPGPWPEQPTGAIGGQIVIGRSISGASVKVTIGCASSEHTLSGHMHVQPLGGFYWHTEEFGRWLQRRLVPGYEGRSFGLELCDGRLSWQIYATEHSHSRDTPRWQQGSIRVDLRDLLLGARQAISTPHAGPVLGLVRMPEGDDHAVELTLRRERWSRRRGRATYRWSVWWDTRDGIPVRCHDGWKSDRVYGSAVQVTDAAVQAGRWAAEACALIAAQLSEDRSRYGWSTTEAK